MNQYLANNESVIIQFRNKQSKRFFYFWLADNCPKNFHSNGQKLTQSSNISLNIQPKSVDLINDELIIEWDDKTSYYPISWLQQFVKTNRANSNDDIQTWQSLQNFPVFNYEEIIHNDNELLNCLLQVKQVGFTKIKNVPVEQNTVLNLVDLFGYVKETNYGKVYNVIAVKDPENLADTNLGLPCHTDNPYRSPLPTIQLLHCLKSDITGGETSLVDGFHIAEQMKISHPEYFRLLSTKSVEFEFKTAHHHLYSKSPILQINQRGDLVRIQFNSRSIQPFRMCDDILPIFYKAYQYLENQLERPENQVRFKLNAGEAIIYDNERILHGRTGYQLIGERHLQGCYSDKDGLYSKIRVLQNQFHSTKKSQTENATVESI